MKAKDLKKMQKLTCYETAMEVQSTIGYTFDCEISLTQAEDLWREFSQNQGYGYYNPSPDEKLDLLMEKFIGFVRKELDSNILKVSVEELDEKK